MKALIAVGGYGTRLYPATHAVPKTMLPLDGKPLIEHIIAEMLHAEIDQIGILYKRNQSCIPQHFRIKSHEAEVARPSTLPRKRKSGERIQFIACDGARSFAGALSYAKRFIAGQTFVLALGDEVFLPTSSPVRELILAHDKTKMVTVACRDVGPPYVLTKPLWDDLLLRITKSGAAPRNIHNCMDIPRGMMIGRYLLTPEFLRSLLKGPRAQREKTFYETMARFAAREEALFVPHVNQWWHCGDHLQYLKATLDHALADPTLLVDLTRYVARTAKRQAAPPVR